MKRRRPLGSLARPQTAPAPEVKANKKKESNFTVAVRVRPHTEREREGPYYNVIEVADEHILTFDSKSAVVADSIRKGVHKDVIGRPRCKDLRLAFDRVFDEHCGQEDVYESTARMLVDDVVDGYNATCFAYGSTGAGKTYTMMGESGSEGVMVRTLRDVFRQVEHDKESKYKISVSYVEIYNENVIDLLSSASHLDIREDHEKGVIIAGASEHHPRSAIDVFKLLERGQLRRTTSPTDANAVSSRSHAVLQVSVEKKKTGKVYIGKLSLVDLAGSERAAATKNHGDRLVEGANINRSLLALGNCITALVDGHAHVPYRDSKLTRLLKDSLGGNCRTVMIANVSPSSMTYDDTHNTLHYANRAKKIKTQKVRNELSVDWHVTQYTQAISELTDENNRLKKKLKLSQASAAFIERPVEDDQLRLFEEFNAEIKVCFNERCQIADAIEQGKGASLQRSERLMAQNTTEVSSLKQDVKSRMENQTLKSALLQTITAHEERHQAMEIKRSVTQQKTRLSQLARQLADAASKHGISDIQDVCSRILADLSVDGMLSGATQSKSPVMDRRPPPRPSSRNSSANSSLISSSVSWAQNTLKTKSILADLEQMQGELHSGPRRQARPKTANPPPSHVQRPVQRPQTAASPKRKRDKTVLQLTRPQKVMRSVKKTSVVEAMEAAMGKENVQNARFLPPVSAPKSRLPRPKSSMAMSRPGSRMGRKQASSVWR